MFVFVFICLLLPLADFICVIHSNYIYYNLHFILGICCLFLCVHRFSLAPVVIDQLYAKTPDQPQKQPASIGDVYVHGVVDPSTVYKVMLRVSDYVCWACLDYA